MTTIKAYDSVAKSRAFGVIHNYLLKHKLDLDFSTLENDIKYLSDPDLKKDIESSKHFILLTCTPETLDSFDYYLWLFARNTTDIIINWDRYVARYLGTTNNNPRGRRGLTGNKK